MLNDAKISNKPKEQHNGRSIVKLPAREPVLNRSKQIQRTTNEPSVQNYAPIGLPTDVVVMHLLFVPASPLQYLINFYGNSIFFTNNPAETDDLDFEANTRKDMIQTFHAVLARFSGDELRVWSEACQAPQQFGCVIISNKDIQAKVFYKLEQFFRITSRRPRHEAGHAVRFNCPNAGKCLNIDHFDT